MPKINKQFFLNIAQEAQRQADLIENKNQLEQKINLNEFNPGLSSTLADAIIVYFKAKLCQKKFGNNRNLNGCFKGFDTYLTDAHLPNLPCENIFNEMLVENNGKFTLENDFDFEECDLIGTYGDADLKAVAERNEEIEDINIKGFNPLTLYIDYYNDFKALVAKREQDRIRDELYIGIENEHEMESQARLRKEEAGTVPRDLIPTIFEKRNSINEEYTQNSRQRFSTFIRNNMNNLDLNSPVENPNGKNDEIHQYTVNKIALFYVVKNKVNSNGGFWKNLFKFNLVNYFKDKAIFKDLTNNLQQKHNINTNTLNYLEKWETDRGVKESLGSLSRGHVLMYIKSQEEINAEKRELEELQRQLNEALKRNAEQTKRSNEEIQKNVKEINEIKQSENFEDEELRASQERLNLALRSRVEQEKQQQKEKNTTKEKIRQANKEKYLKLVEETKKKKNLEKKKEDKKLDV